MSMGNLRLLQQLLGSHSDGFTLNQILSGTDIKIKHIVLSCTKLTELWVEAFKTRSCRVCPSLCFLNCLGFLRVTARAGNPSRLLGEALGQRAPSQFLHRNV